MLPAVTVAAVVAATAACGSEHAGPPAGAAPPAQELAGAGMAFDPATGGVIAFGGTVATAHETTSAARTWSWTGRRWEPVTVRTTPPARAGALLAADPTVNGVLLFGGSTATETTASCPPSNAAPSSGAIAACTGTVTPTRVLSDTWAFVHGDWHQLAPGGGVPQQGQLMAFDPALGAVILVGVSLTANTSGVAGTWAWTGRRWVLLTPTAPAAADSLGYDPTSRRMIAYGGQAPFNPGPGLGAPATVGYSRTWALTPAGWLELHPRHPPERAPGVLTATPKGSRLLLIDTRGRVWAWNGSDWRARPARGGPAARELSGAQLTAAPDPPTGQVVVLVSGGEFGDETWTLEGLQWTPHPGTP